MVLLEAIIWTQRRFAPASVTKVYNSVPSFRSAANNTLPLFSSPMKCVLPSNLSGSTSCARAAECHTGRAMDIGDDNFTRSCTRAILN